MIAIVNISDQIDRFGENEYSLRINTKEIARFKHIRSDPLSVILKKASKAAEDYEYEKEMTMLDAFTETPEYKFNLNKEK